MGAWAYIGREKDEIHFGQIAGPKKSWGDHITTPIIAINMIFPLWECRCVLTKSSHVMPGLSQLLGLELSDRR